MPVLIFKTIALFNNSALVLFPKNVNFPSYKNGLSPFIFKILHYATYFKRQKKNRYLKNSTLKQMLTFCHVYFSSHLSNKVRKEENNINSWSPVWNLFLLTFSPKEGTYYFHVRFCTFATYVFINNIYYCLIYILHEVISYSAWLSITYFFINITFFKIMHVYQAYSF